MPKFEILARAVPAALFLFRLCDPTASLAAASAKACAPALPDDICRIEARIYTATDFHRTDQTRAVLIDLKRLLMVHAGDPPSVRAQLVGLVEHVVEAAHAARVPREILAQSVGRPNLVGIYDELTRFQAAHGPVVPLDWTIPPEIKYLVVTTTRRYVPEHDRTGFEFALFGTLAAEGAVEQAQVIRYPDEVVLDRRAGIGDWKDGHIDATAVPTFSLGIGERASGMPEGLYLLNLKVRGKPMIHGWFVMSGTVPSANPVIRVPAMHETLRTGDPELRWTDFHSPEFRPFNQRKRMLSIYRRGGATGRAWFSVEMYPSAAERLRLSEAPNLLGVRDLANGDYGLSARYEERWFFGGLMIGRAAITDIPFRVEKGR